MYETVFPSSVRIPSYHMSNNTNLPLRSLPVSDSDLAFLTSKSSEASPLPKVENEDVHISMPECLVRPKLPPIKKEESNFILTND